MSAKMSRWKLSPSALNLFRDCPRCFWREKVLKFRRPRGIFPSLPSGMDRVIKTYFDSMRAQGLIPRELQGGDFEGVQLFKDQERLNRWRNWRTGLVYEEESALLTGALDDLLIKGKVYLPFDYKTKGSPTSETDAVRYYQNQMDCYTLLLEKNGFPTASYGFLLYFSPEELLSLGHVSFKIQAIKISTDPDRAMRTLLDAALILSGPEPTALKDCQFCGFSAENPGS